MYWSDMCFEIHRPAPEAPLPKNYIEEYVAPEYQAELRQTFRDCIHHRQERSMDLEILRADGRRLWVRARCEAVLEHGKVVRLRGVTQDIDEARRARLRLSQSEERFSRIFQLMPFPMGLSRCSDGQYVEVNPAWEKLLGIPRSEALGRTSIEMGVLYPGRSREPYPGGRTHQPAQRLRGHHSSPKCPPTHGAAVHAHDGL